MADLEVNNQRAADRSPQSKIVLFENRIQSFRDQGLPSVPSHFKDVAIENDQIGGAAFPLNPNAVFKQTLA